MTNIDNSINTSLITFATDRFLNNAHALTRNALQVGFASAQTLTPQYYLNSDFYERNQGILSMPRGAGYWLWKPYIILKTLEASKNDDIVFYCDAGRTPYYQFTRFPHHLIQEAMSTTHGFLLGPTQPHLGTIKQWTKRDCLILMNADSPNFLSKSLMITWSIWRNTKAAREFLETWLQYSEDYRCLTDAENVCGLPNYDEFSDHRHDMSIMSLLAYKQGAPYLDFSRTITHKFLTLRPQSGLAHNFYKRPENADRLLESDNPLLLFREFFRLRENSPLR